MKCNSILIGVLVVLLITSIVYGLDRLRLYQSMSDAVTIWSTNHIPSCKTYGFESAPCPDLLNPGKFPPASESGYDAKRTMYALQLVSSFIAGVSCDTCENYLKLPDIDSLPTLISANIDKTPFAAIWKLNDTAIVAIRGTQTVADMSANLRYSKMSAYPDSPEIGVHSGMYGIYADIKDSLFKTIGDSKNIFIAGHSLGSAIGFYFALDCAIASLKVEVIGIGAPRAGNQAFSTKLTSLCKVTTVINLADMVPSLPWSYMPNFFGTGKDTDPRQYSHSGTIVMFNIQAPNIVACHEPPIYFSGLKSNVSIVN